jgi:hypothetical protein
MLSMKLIQIVALVAACLLLLFLGTKIFQNWQFHKQVCLLFAGSPRVSHQVFQYSQIQELPEPVQKYFRLVIPERQAYISTIRLKHKGQFKTGLDNPWTDITGEQYFTGDRPGFVWEGTTTFMSARDMFSRGPSMMPTMRTRRLSKVNWWLTAKSRIARTCSSTSLR